MPTRAADGWNGFDIEPPTGETILLYAESGDGEYYWIGSGTWDADHNRVVIPLGSIGEGRRVLFWRLYPDIPPARRIAGARKRPIVECVSDWQLLTEAKPRAAETEDDIRARLSAEEYQTRQKRLALAQKWAGEN